MATIKREPDVGTSMPNGRSGGSNVTVPSELNDIERLIYTTVAEYPDGLPVTDLVPKIPSLSQADILENVNALSKKSLLEFQMIGIATYVRIIELKDYQKTSTLDSDSKLIYNWIRDSGSEGIWTKDLKKHTNLHINVVNRVLKALEHKQLVKSVKHVKWPTRRIYMLYDVTPSSEVTGGAWYTDQELDTDFIETLAVTCYKYIYSRSFPRDKSIIYRAGYDHYPSAAEVKRFIQEKRISSVELTIQDINCLLDLLVHDDMIEKLMPFGMSMEEMDDDEDSKGDSIEWVYKVIDRTIISPVATKTPIDALSEVPCGTCPVFKFCTEDGPISPFNCQYYQKWLDF
ncbi:hypothetical protein NQZ79_g3077 [Umbelopsis isabellina]|nr:hypothetical protein NQZ79_g3077 [Umbelopsis isabellina]